MDRASKSPSPDRRFSKLLKTTSSRQSTPDLSNVSLSRAESNSDQTGFRRSIDRGIASLKDKARKDSDTSDAGAGSSDAKRPSRLSRLVPKRSKRKLKDGDNDSSSDYSPVVDRSPSLKPGNETGSKLNLPSDANASIESLGKSAASSLLTEDSDLDRSPSRPELTNRQSHKGYLTFSSPLVAAETVEAPETVHEEEQESRPTLEDPFASEEQPARSHTRQRARSPKKASTYPRSDAKRPTSVASSKPAVKLDSPDSERPGTPSTYITPPTPVIDNSSSPSPPKTSPKHSPKNSLALGSLPSKPFSASPKESLAHRRTRSATTASTKSVAQPPALTPHVEEAKTPGGSVIQPSGSSSFFASVFSATQNAVTQISNSINAQQAGNRSRSSTTSSAPSRQSYTASKTDTSADPVHIQQEADVPVAEKKEPAIATLGSGNLSLTHLGIVDPGSDSENMTSRANANEGAPRSRTSISNGAARSNGPVSTQEDAIAAETAVSAAYGGKTPSEKSVPIVFDNNNDGSRPRSLTSLQTSLNADGTPQRSATQASETGDGASFKRAGSVRSRLSGRRIRHRNSSAAGGAIASALAASHGAIANPGSRRPTGFAVANAKRNRDFHKDFKSVPEDDHLIEDFSAALQKDILLHGRFYISEQHICFGSNILGWTTNLVISFDEVVAIEKKSTAIIFPNAIVVQTLHAKNVFASFINRDATYELLIRIWRIGHPNLKATETGHSLDEAAADKAELAPSLESTGSSDEDSEEDDEDMDYVEDAASSVGRAPSIAPSEAADTVRVVSRPQQANGSPGLPATGAVAKAADTSLPTLPANQDFPGPATHAITQCSDSETHYANQVLDTTIPAPLGKVFSIFYGAESGKAMRKFLIDDQKSLELQLEDDGKGLTEDKRSFSHSYIKPLSGSIGPKQTKCLVTTTLDSFDLEKAITVTCSTQTPDVPSGNIFVTKTRYCLMWGPGNSTRILMSCAVEWSGKSWLKGPIEKGANDGQAQYGKDVAAFLKSQLASKSPAKSAKTGKTKGKKKKSGTDLTQADSVVDGDKAAAAAQAKNQGGGPLGILSDIVGPASDVVGSFMSVTGLLAIALLIMTFLYLRSPSSVGSSRDSFAFSGLATPERLAAYDQLWRREESQLWEWLEDRLQLDEFRVHAQVPSQDDRLLKSMSDRQIDDAIRVTEERLQSLKGVVEHKKAESASSIPSDG